VAVSVSRFGRHAPVMPQPVLLCMVCVRRMLMSFAVVVLTVSTARPAAAADLDCVDFGTRQAADHYFDSHPADIDLLDADRDGGACERRPNAGVWAVFGGYGAGLMGAVWYTRRQHEQGERWSGSDYGGAVAGSFLFGIPGTVAASYLVAYLPRQTPAMVLAVLAAVVTAATVAIFAHRYA
jgi:hypothetical protein